MVVGEPEGARMRRLVVGVEPWSAAAMHGLGVGVEPWNAAAMHRRGGGVEPWSAERSGGCTGLVTAESLGAPRRGRRHGDGVEPWSAAADAPAWGRRRALERGSEGAGMVTA